MNPRGFVDRIGPVPRLRFRERLPPRVVRMVWLGALAADASEHGGRIVIIALILEVKRRKGNSPFSLSLKRFSH
jgi:hypothetical protein